MDLQERIGTSKEYDWEAADAIKFLLEDGPDKLKKDLKDWTYEIHNNKTLFFFRGKAYIPRDLELRREIVKRFHDGITAGHPGELETYHAVKTHYYWPGMRIFVKNYIKGCAECQQFKINRHPTKVTLIPTQKPPTTRPFAHVSMDFITDLPESNGYDSILVVVDQGLTKGVILTPCNKTITAEDTAKLLQETLFRRFRLPDKIISDCGPQFAAKLFRELLRLLGIQSAPSTTYHPQTDGTTERYNQEIEAYLAIYCYQNPETWADHIATLEFTHNHRRHAGRQHSSFELLMGTQPLSIPTAFETTNIPAATSHAETLLKLQNEALAAYELAAQRMIERSKRKPVKFKEGQKVWLEAMNLNLPYQLKKMSTKREGPFEIAEVMGPITYRLLLPKQWKIHDVFHATLLTPFEETDAHGPAYLEPPPDLIDGENEYEVETILKHRRRGNGFQYLVKWKGYATAENKWIGPSLMGNAEELLAEYKEKNKDTMTKKKKKKT